MTENDPIQMPVDSRPILWIVLISFSMLVVDNSIVFTGLSKIQSELGFTDEGLSWITSLYALTFGGFLLLGARAGDVFGRRFVFTVGLTIFDNCHRSPASRHRASRNGRMDRSLDHPVTGRQRSPVRRICVCSDAGCCTAHSAPLVRERRAQRSLCGSRPVSQCEHRFYFFISQYMQGVLGMSAATAGLAFLPSTIVNFSAAMWIPRFMKRFGSANAMMFTIGCGLAGILMLSFVTPSSGYWSALFLPMMLVGVGQGGTLAPLTSSGISGVGREDAGAASGLVNASHQVGTSLGIAIITAYAATADADLGGLELLADRVRLAMQASSAMMLLTLLIVCIFIVRRKKVQIA